MSSIADNLRRVEERIARAAESVGRQPSEILLVGVTKYVGPREAAELAAAGCNQLGESRPQELWKKAEALSSDRGIADPINWHLIGHLQTNKVRRTVPQVKLIHSVDSERLMAALNQACEDPADKSRSVDVLLEVNTSGEAAKHGLRPDDVAGLLDASPRYPNVFIRGLMTMAALDGGLEVAARNFAGLRELRDRLKSNLPDRLVLNELSMGMSDDFEVAIKEGATIVRVGSALWD